jgi:hypothetical protein
MQAFNAAALKLNTTTPDLLHNKPVLLREILSYHVTRTIVPSPQAMAAAAKDFLMLNGGTIRVRRHRCAPSSAGWQFLLLCLGRCIGGAQAGALRLGTGRAIRGWSGTPTLRC